MNKGTIVAIIRDVDPQDATAIGEVLLENKINWVEVSLSNEEKGLKCIEALNEKFGTRIHLGVGTVTNQEQVDKAIRSGAKYIITPGWDRELTKYIQSKNVTIFPGVFTPGDIMQAQNEKIEVVKLFPTNALGLGYVKSLFGPFPNIHVMAVGGINKNNILDYYRAGCSSFAIGSELVPRGATKKDLEKIKTNAIEYVRIMGEVV